MIIQKNTQLNIFSKKKVDIWDLKGLLSAKCDFKSRELAFQNECYRIATTLKSYAGVKDEVRFNFVLEHGTYMIKNYAYTRDIIHNVPIVTFGEARKKVLEQVWKKEVYTIGPYVAYASDYYSPERIKEIKDEFGKILLVFPTHTVDESFLGYDFKDLILEIERVKCEKSFDTVMVCLHWIDITKGFEKKYKKAGYQVVCAGRSEDEAFLSRLKTIINLSDAVMLNDVGTSLAYALYLDKPCYIYKQDILDMNGKYIMSDEYYRLLEAFGNDDLILTNENRKLSDYIYGFSKVKKKEEMKQFILDHSRGM